MGERYEEAAMTNKLLLQVNGMSCTGCEERIVSALTRLDGVSHGEADHRRGEVRLRFDPNLVTPQAIRERIEFAGYDVAADTRAAR